MRWSRILLGICTFGGAALTLLGPSSAQETQPLNWEAQLRAELPPEYGKLKQMIGHSEGEYEVTREHHPTTGPSTAGFAKTEYCYNEDVNGSKLVTTYKGNSSADVLCSNADQSFSLEKDLPDHPYYLRKFSPSPGSGVDENRWLMAAYDVSAAQLPDLLSGKRGKVTSVHPVTVGNRQLIRVECDRKFNDTEKLYPCWALVDPAFHWAITSFNQEYAWGSSTGTITYRSDVAEGAFPERVVVQDLDSKGNVASADTVTFTKPSRCTATANDFTLAAFGLEPPHVATSVSPKSHSYGLYMAGVILILAGLILLVVFYHQRNRTVTSTNG